METCPSCGRTEPEHTDDCHIAWAQSLRHVPDRVIINRYLEILKQVSKEMPLVETEQEK